MIYLRGFLPSEAKRDLLLQILQDTLGFQDIIDEILIDPLLWERKDRASGEKQEAGEVGEIITVVEEGSRDLSRNVALETEDAPMTPPDELIPDEERQD